MTRLLKVQTDPFRHQFIIEKRKNTYEGQTVMDAYGVVGVVNEVGPFSATVLLITEPSLGIPVRSLRSGARGIVHGAGSFEHLELKNVSETANFQEGDILVTSGVGGVFVEGLMVGVLTEKQRDPFQGFSHWEVKPYAHFNESQNFLLIDTPEKEGLS